MTLIDCMAALLKPGSCWPVVAGKSAVPKFKPAKHSQVPGTEMHCCSCCVPKTFLLRRDPKPTTIRQTNAVHFSVAPVGSDVCPFSCRSLQENSGRTSFEQQSLIDEKAELLARLKERFEVELCGGREALAAAGGGIFFVRNLMEASACYQAVYRLAYGLRGWNMQVQVRLMASV